MPLIRAIRKNSSKLLTSTNCNNCNDYWNKSNFAFIKNQDS